MTESELRTVSNEYNSATNATQGRHEVYNTAMNWKLLLDKIKSGRAKDVALEPKKNGEPCIITGSGPSLDKTIEKLKDWKGGIVCHFSQALSLMYFGIEPDYIVALDAICNWEGLKGVAWEKTKTKLIMHPGMWPSLAENWPNEILLYRQDLGKADSFSKREQKTMFSDRIGTLEQILTGYTHFESLINTELVMFACTPPAQLLLADMLGYGKIFLTGLDFAYTDDKYRFSNYEVNDEGKWFKRVIPVEKPKEKLILTTSGHYTEPLHMFYKKNFISAWRLSKHQVFTTDDGAIIEMPKANIDAVIKNQGRGFKGIPAEQIIRDSERYLASIGCWVIEHDKGVAFVEAAKIEHIIQHMQEQNKNYICSKCRKTMRANNTELHGDEDCPVCKEGKLEYINYVDIDANVKRFKKHEEWLKGKK